MKIVPEALSLILAASALVGVQILLEDRWLWSVAPSHAYGLVAFVAMDLALSVIVLGRFNLAVLGAGMIATAQMGAMLADLLSGQPESVQPLAFRAYLTNDISYIGLLIIQVAILVVAATSMIAPYSRRHPHWTGFLHRPRS